MSTNTADELLVTKPLTDAYEYTYVWVDGDGGLRNKSMIRQTGKLEKLPWWTYDGSSTNQAEGFRSDIRLKPVTLFNDPFQEKGFLVLCETYVYDHDTGVVVPHETNARHSCLNTMNQVKDEEPMFGVEQEYILYDRTGKPFEWLEKSDPGLGGQGPYYCGVGGDRAFGRDIAMEHKDKCLAAGVKICGTNAEVMASQWEYQIGICTGIEMGDHMLMARYIMDRVTEKYGARADLEPKPMKGDWNGSGCHTNFSTKTMREEGGLAAILEARDKLANNHEVHMEVYGKNNRERMSGQHETSNYDKFSKGVYDGIGDRSASVRIPLHVYQDGKGYGEDRRPGGNACIYKVTDRLIKTICLNE